jgi:thiamine kinase-like enzyme
MFIDLEYVGLNPRAFDIANYCNETALDNSYPLKNGIAYYLENYITESELDLLMKQYLKRFYEKYYLGDKSKSLEIYLTE